MDIIYIMANPNINHPFSRHPPWIASLDRCPSGRRCGVLGACAAAAGAGCSAGGEGGGGQGGPPRRMVLVGNAEGFDEGIGGYI